MSRNQAISILIIAACALAVTMPYLASLNNMGKRFGLTSSIAVLGTSVFVTGTTNIGGVDDPSMAFIARLNGTTGKPLWISTPTDTSEVTPPSIAAGNDSMYMAVHKMQDGISSDAVVYKYWLNGTRAWDVSLRGASGASFTSVSIQGLAADENAVYIGLQLFSGSFSRYLAVFDANGSFNWIKDISDIFDDLADISVVNGSIFAAGRDNITLGNRALACYNATGDLAWNRTRGGAENDGADAICVNSSTVYVLGYNNNDLLEYPTYPVIDAYSVNGTFLWEVDYAGDYLFLNAIGASNSSVAACGFDRSPATSYDGVVKTFSTTGSALISVHWGTPGEDNGYSVEFLDTDIVSAGRVQVVGTTNHAPFVARFSASGVQSWNWTWATP